MSGINDPPSYWLNNIDQSAMMKNKFCIFTKKRLSNAKGCKYQPLHDGFYLYHGEKNEVQALKSYLMKLKYPFVLKTKEELYYQLSEYMYLDSDEIKEKFLDLHINLPIGTRTWMDRFAIDFQRMVSIPISMPTNELMSSLDTAGSKLEIWYAPKNEQIITESDLYRFKMQVAASMVH